MVKTAGCGSGTAMEKPKHWMWMRRKVFVKNDEKPYVRSIIGDSWEEQAFAEDTAGPLGGFMWPPRSYSCSFCGREFRSAQALGGHMNVHRRDRARLKQQSPTPQNDANPSILDVVHEYPSRILYNSNPAGSTFVLSSSSSPSRVSSVLVPISAQENCSTTTTTDDSCEDQEKGSLLSLKLSSTITTTTTTTTTSSSDSSKFEIKEKNSSSKAVYEETAAGGLVLVQNNQEIVKFDSDVSLNLAMLRPYRPTVSADSSSSDDQEVVHIGCKKQRRRTDHVALSLALSIKSTHHSLDKCDDIHFQNFPSPMEELDLELRLGNHPN